MDFDLIPFESVSQADLRPSALHLIKKLALEMQDHKIALFTNQTLYPGMENFRIASFDKNDILGDWCISFKTLAELDESYGYIIREYGQLDGDRAFIKDNFLPFSVGLQLQDEKFKQILTDEIESISALMISELETLMSVAIENAVADDLMKVLYEDAVRCKNQDPSFYAKPVLAIKRQLANLIYTRLIKFKKTDTKKILVNSLPRFVV